MTTRLCTKCKARKALKKRNQCWKCSGKIGSRARRRAKALKRLGTVCSDCGFDPVNKCQVDIHHIDGDNKNQDESNLQVLCANCHRLKTLINEDWRSNG